MTHPFASARWPPITRGTSWLQWLQGCHGDDFQSWCGPGIGYQVCNGVQPWNLQEIETGEVSGTIHLQRLKKKQQHWNHWNLQDFEISRIDFFMSFINSNAANALNWTNSDWCIVWYLSSFVQVESFLHLAMLWHRVLAKGCQAHPGASDFTRPVDPVVI